MNDWNPTLRDRIRWLWVFWRPNRAFLVLLFFVTLVSSGVAIAYPLVFRTVIDRLMGALPGSATPATVDPEVLRPILGILALIALGRFFAGFYPAFRAWVNLKIDVAIRQKVYASILEKDHRFFEHFRTGDLSTRLLDDIMEYPKLAWFSCSGIFRPVDSGSKLLFALIAMTALNAKLALLAITPLPIMLYVIYRTRSALRDAIMAQQGAISETNDMLEASFSGIRIVKAFKAEPHQSRALSAILGRRVGVQLRVRSLFAAVDILDTVASRAGQLVVLAVGGLMVIQGELSLGTLYAMYMYLDILVLPMVDLPNLFVTSRQAFVCMDREEEVMRFSVGVRHRAEGRVIDRIETIRLEGVSFSFDDAPKSDVVAAPGFVPAANAEPNRILTASYPDALPHAAPDRDADGTGNNGSPVSLRDTAGVSATSEKRWALRDFDLELRGGETVAIVGEVGAGKTALLRLLAGQLHPTHGRVLVNGVPFDDVSWPSYRSRVGFAPQESILFSETIRENVELGRGDDATARVANRAKRTNDPPAASGARGSPRAGANQGSTAAGSERRSPAAGEEQGSSATSAETLLRLVQMESELARMDKGIDTVLGQRGSRVSGGQRQRISVARALYGRPDLLLLDDTTSSLDAENEDRVWHGLRQISPGAIVLLVSHRLATIARADRILVIERGRLVDQGTHDELMARCEAYRRFQHREEERAVVRGVSS